MQYLLMYSLAQHRPLADVTVLTNYQGRPVDDCPALVRWTGASSWVIWPTLAGFQAVSMNPDMAHDKRELRDATKPSWVKRDGEGGLAHFAELAALFYDEGQ